jgi:hypothetical protein
MFLFAGIFYEKNLIRRERKIASFGEKKKGILACIRDR